MVYFTGVLTKVNKSGVVINAGEATRCNIYVAVDEHTRLAQRLEVGRLAKIMAVPRWRKSRDDDDEHFSLAFTAIQIDLK